MIKYICEYSKNLILVEKQKIRLELLDLNLNLRDQPLLSFNEKEILNNSDKPYRIFLNYV